MSRTWSIAILAALGIGGVALALAVSTNGHDRAGRASAAPPPVVFIVFDEFSSTSLLDRQHRIDPVRYPAFASLAAGATWFPYATASVDETGRAMEALLTGSTPPRGRLATYAFNQRNLFTLLGHRWRIDASEEVTSMCPRRLCPHVRPQNHLSILHELAHWRPRRFERWVRTIGPSSKPTLFFKHALLPHGPFEYLPSGRSYAAPHEPIPGYAHAFFSRWVTEQKYQRHLLQLSFTDRLLGSALRRLRETGLYDRSLIVVTADNGESFGRLGNGHEISSRDVGDIALTPLIIKAPYQRRGRIVTRHVRTVDVLPSVAHLLHLRLPWRTQGRSIYGAAGRRIPAATTVIQRSGRRFRLSLGRLRRWAAGALQLKLGLFGSGNEPPGLYGIGPYRGLVGASLAGLHPAPRGAASATLDRPRAFRAVSLSSSFLPTHVTGQVRGGAPPAVAVAVNGRIAATSPTFRIQPGGPLYFSALLPESALRDGPNPVELLSVAGSPQTPLLGVLWP